MTLRIRTLILLTCFVVSTAAIADENVEHSLTNNTENLSQLVKKLRSDNSSLPISQLIEKRADFRGDNSLPFLASPVFSSTRNFNRPNQQAGR